MHRTLIFFLNSFSLFGLFIVLPLLCSAQSSDNWKSRIDKKSPARWSLNEWMEQKGRNQWMDQWLILHTPTPYEFMLDLSSKSYTIDSDASTPHHQSLIGSFTAYATLVGLEFQHENNSSEGFIDNTGIFLFRLMGSADQGSHLTFGVGQKTRHYNNLNLPLRAQYLGIVDLTLYFNNHFGFKFLNQKYNPLSNDTDYGDLSGFYQSLNLFIDFSALRIFGGPFLERETQTINGLTTHRNINGAQGGLRLYF